MRKQPILLLAAGTTLALATVASGGPTTINLFGTGSDGSGNVLGAGYADQHYTAWAGALGAKPATPSHAVVLSTTSHYATWQPNDASSAWINYQDTYYTTGAHTFETSFSLTGYDPSTASLQITCSADNGLEIYLNGVDTGDSIPTSNWTDLYTFTLHSGFNAGQNTLDFYVPQMDWADGLLVRPMTLTANPLPGVPDSGATAGLLGLAIIALKYLRRH